MSSSHVWSAMVLLAASSACFTDPEPGSPDEAERRAEEAGLEAPAPSLAAATTPYLQTATARSVGFHTFSLVAGKTYTFATSALQPSSGIGDTVLYLVRPGGGAQLAHNDDEAAGVRTSRVTYTVPGAAGGTYHVIVVAKANSGYGKATLTVWNGTSLHWTGNTYFGGDERAVPKSVAGAVIVHDTVPMPGGVADPILFGLDTTGRLAAWSDDGGVGTGDRVSALAVARVVVGARASTVGAVRLLSNDAFADADGDGLGAMAEAALGSCDARPPGPCAAVINLRDSDRDGLDDQAEAIGLDTTPPQYLPRWGADPRRKDVFVELDWYTPTYPTQPLTEAMAMAMRDAFAVGPAGDVRNLDGSAGIQLHLDVGFAATQAGNLTLLGNWGGATGTATGDSSVNLAAARRGVFVSGLLNANSGGGWNGWFQAGIGGGPPGQAVQTVTHELGHALLLNHEGYLRYDWGLNCNPIYASTMSYTSSTHLYSDGLVYGGLTLNPASLCESEGLLGGPIAHLANAWGLGIANGVDWNNDGIYSSCTQRVRAAVNWNRYSGCDAQDDGAVEVATGMRPAMVYLDGWMYVFYARGGSIFYVRAPMSSALAATNGCPTGFRRAIGTTCSTWSAEELLPFPAFDMILGSAHAVGSEVHLAFTSSTGAHAIALPTRDAAGRFTSFAAIETVAGARAVRGPELAMMEVSPARFGGRSQLEIMMWPSANPVTNLELRWSFRNFGGGYAAERAVLDVNNAPIVTAAVAPTLLTWGDVQTQGASQTLLAVPDLNHRVRVYAYEPDLDRWRDRTAQFFPNPPTDDVTTKIAFAFHPLLDDQGRVLAPHKGDFYLAYKTNGYAKSGGTLWISNVIGVATPPATSLVFNRNGVYGHVYLELDGQYGDLELFSTPGFPFLKGVMVKPPGVAGQPPKIVVNPFADGVSDISFRNGSDFRVMERSICLVMRNGDTAWCGGPNPWGY